MQKEILYYYSTDSGNSQVYFKNKEKKLLYCFRSNYKNCFELDICTSVGEADHPVDANRFYFDITDMSKTEKLCNELRNFLDLPIYYECLKLKTEYKTNFTGTIDSEGIYQKKFFDMFPDIGIYGLVSIWESTKAEANKNKKV